jgi:hypothetical protein
MRMRPAFVLELRSLSKDLLERQYARPHLHVERNLRKMYRFHKMLPDEHVQLLLDFLKLAPHLQVHSGRFSRPVLRHPSQLLQRHCGNN